MCPPHGEAHLSQAPDPQNGHCKVSPKAGWPSSPRGMEGRGCQPLAQTALQLPLLALLLSVSFQSLV